MFKQNRQCFFFNTFTKMIIKFLSQTRQKTKKNVKNKCYDLKFESFRDLKKNACNESLYYLRI